MAAFALVFVPPWVAFRFARGWQQTIVWSVGLGLARTWWRSRRDPLDQPFGPVLVVAFFSWPRRGHWPAPESRTRRVAAVLWVTAFVLMAGAAVWQRLTGPTHPKRGHVIVAGETVKWRLLRSGTTGEPLHGRGARARAASREAPSATAAFPLDEPFTRGRR